MTMKMITSTTPTIQAVVPALIESAPRSGPTVRSSKMMRGAGTQQQRQIGRRLHGEASRDDAAAAEDRLADDGGGDHLAVEDDGEGLADILLRRIAEAASAGGVELEPDHRLVVLEGRVGIDQQVAADDHSLADDIRRRLTRAAPVGF